MKSYWTIVLIALLVLAAALRLWDFGSPWTDDPRGWGGSFYGNIARNYLEFGYAETKAAPVRSVNPPDAGHFEYYLDHPPMTGWLVSLSFRVFGYCEWAARLVSVLCSMGGLILLFLIFRRFWKPKVVLIAMALAAVAPMAVFYGSFVDVQGPIPFFFILLAFFLYLRFDEKRMWGRWLLVLAAFFLATLSDWPAYYLVPVILVHHFFSRREEGRKWRVLLLPAVALAVIALFVLYVNWVQYGEASFDINQMVGWFMHRAVSTAHEGSGESYNVFGWLGKIIQNLRLMFTLPVLVLAATGALFYFVKIIARERDRGDGVLAALLAIGLMHIVIFQQGAYVHPFWGYYLYPAIALLVALCIVRFGEALLTRVSAVRAIFYLAITLAACAASTLQDVNLQRTQSSADYARLGGTLKDYVSPRTLILAEEKLPDFWNYRFAFYIANQMEYAKPCAPNLQVSDSHKEGVVFLMNMENPGDPVMSNFKTAVQEYAVKHDSNRMRVAAAFAVDVAGMWPALGEAGVAPPHDIKVDYSGWRINVSWQHDESQKVKRFNIYARFDAQIFYTDASDYFTFSGNGEAAMRYDLRAPVTIIVTAVDEDGRETGFAEEARISP